MWDAGLMLALPWKGMMSRADTNMAYKRIGFDYSKPGKRNPWEL